jgi:hypothetical protein
MFIFAKLLNQYMINKGHSNGWVAWKSGLARQTLIHWRQGEVKRPNCEKLLRVSIALQLSPQEQHDLLKAANCKKEAPPDLLPIVNNPIMAPKQLFGRHDILSRIKWVWDKMPIENIAILGPRASGKTSLLHYLERVSTANELRVDQPKGWNGWWPHDFQFAIINFHDPGMCEPDILVEEVLQQLELPKPESCDLRCFSQILRKLTKPTIIMMDEVGAGLDSENLTKEFWHNMRFLTGNNAYLGYLVTAHEPLPKLAQDANKPSPFFNMFGAFLELEPFTLEEAREFLTYLPNNVPQKDKEWILEKSRNWPVLLQHLCDERLIALKDRQSETIWKTNALKRIDQYQHLS